MAAASVNHVMAVKIILEERPQAALDVDLQGRTALHIAAELGCMDVVDILRSGALEGPDAPVDLAGHTPLGRAITSQHREAKQNQTQLKAKLFSPGDVSVYGRPTPAKTRSSQLGLQLEYGYADMPGLRVVMEDAISCHVWHGHALLGVCDGHGDHGRVSEFVAEGVADNLKKQLSATDDVFAAWKSACLDMDAQLKQTDRKGGSTAVWALVTDTNVVVANVGDSRCILIQKPSLEQLMETLKLQEAKKKAETSDSEKSEDEEKPTQLKYVVMPMSQDHKPNLELEQARIEKAGLSVVAESFMEDGVKQTIHKVQRSETDRMAVSRSFGDFEYKGNTELAADEQAVVATPEIQILTRDKERDMFLILACDGVWDVMSSQEVGDFVVSRIEAMIESQEEDILPTVGDELLNECLQRGSTDNMTTVIVALSQVAEALGSPSVLEAKTLDFQAVHTGSPS
jgi:serine/threonine protein phosphatase PrpC